MKKVTPQVFLEGLHSRKRELAADLMNDVHPGTLQQKGFSPAIITQMAHKIRREVELMENFRVEFAVDQQNRVVGVPTEAAEVIEESQKKTQHATMSYTNAPLEGGCCEG